MEISGNGSHGIFLDYQSTLLEKRSAEIRAEKIPEMTTFVNKENNERDEKNHIKLIDERNVEESTKIREDKLESHIEKVSKINDINEINKEAAESTFHQSTISNTLSLSGVTNDLMQTLYNFRNNISKA